MNAIRKAARIPKMITTTRIRWSFLGVASVFVEEEEVLELVVEDVVAAGKGDMAKGLKHKDDCSCLQGVDLVPRVYPG